MSSLASCQPTLDVGKLANYEIKRKFGNGWKTG